MTTLSTHDTKRSRGRARPARGARRDPGASGRPGSGAGRPPHPLPDRSLEPPGVAEPGRRLADLGRAAGGLPGQGVAGGQARHQPRRLRTRRSTRLWRRGRSRCSATPGSWRGRGVRRDGSTRRAGSTRSAQKLVQIAGPGRAGRVPGHRALRVLAGGSGQPAAGRLGAAPAVARAHRRRVVAGVRGASDVDPEGATKLLVTAQALLLRRQRPELFAGYRSVPAEGPAAEHAIAFARSAQLVAVATRLPVGLAARGGWADTVLPLPDGVAAWTDVLTGTPVGSSAPGSRRCWRATRSRCWSGPGDRRRPQAVLRSPARTWRASRAARTVGVTAALRHRGRALCRRSAHPTPRFPRWCSAG